jgi:transcriptional regulator with XRE-family HTH domain
MSQLKQIRRERQLSLEAVGYLAGVDAATISRIENGLVVPRPETVVRIAQALGVAVSRIAPNEQAAV